MPPLKLINKSRDKFSHWNAVPTVNIRKPVQFKSCVREHSSSQLWNSNLVSWRNMSRYFVDCTVQNRNQKANHLVCIYFLMMSFVFAPVVKNKPNLPNVFTSMTLSMTPPPTPPPPKNDIIYVSLFVYFFFSFSFSFSLLLFFAGF